MSTALQKTPLEKEASDVFIVGLLSLAFPVGPVAWYLGSQYKANCQEQGVEPDQNAVIGMTIGMVMSVLLGAFVGVFVLFFVVWCVLFVGLLFILLLSFAFAAIAAVVAAMLGATGGAAGLL